MKSFFKTFSILALLSICIIVYSCQTDDIPTQQTETLQTINKPKGNPLVSAKVKQEQVSDILHKITGKLSGDAKIKNNKIKQDNITILLDDITELKKQGKHINYTFPVVVEGTPLNEMYTLTVDKYADGKVGQLLIAKYVLTDKTLDYILQQDGEVDFRKFKATYNYYDFDTFVKSKGQLKTEGCPGTLGSDPGEYPTTPPGGSFSHTAFGTTFQRHFGSNVISGNSYYVYTSTVTDGSG